MANFYDFSSDKINVFYLLIDSSGSMEDYEKDVIRGIREYKKSFENFPEVDSIAVSLSKFANDFYPEYFTRVSEISEKYFADGATALYYSIIRGAKHLEKYIDDIVKIKRCVPRGTFIVFSDGKPYCDKAQKSEAKKAIERLNMAGITTVFVAFGEAMESKFGKKLCFQSTIDVNADKEILVDFLGKELSKSCKEQSRSMKALGANFFSQAASNSNSVSGYSAKTEQALEDNDWFEDI